ncbi:uncharacterized protein [Musca autumnalis]|uniref:uncharacterized protein n=1 Tax=Musca autumnalis TaxID=221902 RepID=UPI003CFACEA6
MKFYTLFGVLAVCLMAFAVNVNSYYIDAEGPVDFNPDSFEFKGTDAPETAETAETDEPPTDAPHHHGPGDVEEIHRYVEHLLTVANQLIETVLETFHQGSSFKPHPHFPHPDYSQGLLPDHHHDSEEDNHIPEQFNNHDKPEEDNDDHEHHNDNHEGPQEDGHDNHKESEEDKEVPEHPKKSDEDKRVPEHHEEEPKKDNHVPDHH